MTIFAKTADSVKLLADIRKAIDAGTVVTWSYDTRGDFTHTPPQWKNKAWLRPKIEVNRLVFGIVRRRDEALSTLVYGVYHGRFVEMLVGHFDSSCDSVEASARLQRSYDIT